MELYGTKTNNILTFWTSLKNSLHQCKKNLFGVKKVQSGFTKDTQYKITVAMEKSGNGRKVETDNQMKDNVQKYLYAIKVRITEIMGHAIDTTWAVELNTQEHYVSF